MYDYIKGELKLKAAGKIVVEVNSVGWSIETNSRVIQTLPDEGESVKIYLVLIHREDTMYFCGFSNREDREIFKILTTVSGIGTKVALTLLEEFSSADLITIVADEDHKQLSKAKGVGTKLAQKVIIELKDKLLNFQNKSGIVLESVPSQGKMFSGEKIDEVRSVLVSFGYSAAEIKDSLEKAASSLDVSADSQEILKAALQILANSQ